MRVDLSGAVAAGVISFEHAEALRGAVIDRGTAVELRMHDLSDDEREALDRLVIWLDRAQGCGK